METEDSLTHSSEPNNGPYNREWWYHYSVLTMTAGSVQWVVTGLLAEIRFLAEAETSFFTATVSRPTLELIRRRNSNFSRVKN